MLDADRCWKAVLARDNGEDGRFYFGVVTTGVFCRPSCRSRKPLRRNVRFYETPQEAQRDGMRPCLRCQPLRAADVSSGAARMWKLCDYIRRHSDEPLTLADMSRRSGLSRFHLQRTFKSVVGVTPKQFQQSCRLARFKKALRERESVTEAIYEAGFGSGSRIYERVDTRLGMTPTEYRAGGQSISITFVDVETPLGLMMVGATDRGLCFVQFGESADQLAGALRREYPAAALHPMAKPYPREFRRWMDALRNHLRGSQPSLDLPLDVRASAFQLKVWKYLESIPYGEVQSYGEIARGIGRPRSARAVARACASNPVAVVIPCHRVIRSNGELGGYRWGLHRKRALIDNERKMKAQA